MKKFTVAAMVLIAVATSPLGGQSTVEQNRVLCGDNKASADIRIGACTAVIQSGQFSTTDLAIAVANRGLAYIDKNELTRARDDFEQALRLDSRSAVAYRGRGLLFARLKDFDRALADEAKAIELEPSPESYYSRGLTYLDMGNNADAVSSLSRSIASRPAFAQAYFLRALAYLRLGDNPNAIADNTQAISRDANLSEAYFNRGLAWRRSKDLDKAISDFGAYVRLSPTDIAGWYQRGQARYEKGDNAGALADFNQALTLKPDDAPTLFERGRVHINERRYDAAVADFTRVLAIDPSGYGAAAYYNRAYSLVGAGDRSRAFPDYEKAAALDPHDVDAPSRLVEAGVALKRYDDAEKYLRVLMAQFPAALAGKRTQALQIVRFHQLKRNWAKADELLTAYLKAVPPAAAGSTPPSAAVAAANEEAVNRLRARTAAGLGRYTEALDLLQRTDARATFVLARVDNTFAPLWDLPTFESVLDLKAQAARAVTKAEEQIRTEPTKLGAIVTRLRALRNAERFQDAIQAAEQTLAGDLAKFTDREDQEVWVYNEIAGAARDLGDSVRAELAYRTGVDRIGLKNTNVVNLLLNGGLFLCRIGQFRDALTFADRADATGVSAFGAMIANRIRVIAYSGLSQTADAARIAAEMDKHVDDNPVGMLDVYFLQNRKDDAANLLARLLADPARVDSMLLDLQRYNSGPAYPGTIPPTAKVINEGWNSIAAHPTVAAAIKAVGRITSIPLRGY